MAGKKQPGPMCQAQEPISIDEGTMCLSETPVPGSSGTNGQLPSLILLRPSQMATKEQPARVAEEVSISLGATTAWEAYVRQLYNEGAKAIRAQAQELTRTGQMTHDAAKDWANGQRNALMNAMRDKSTPLGRAIAEAIKPQGKTVKELEQLGKSAAGIIESAGKTNLIVNRIAIGFRYAGPTLLVVGLSFSAYNIATAPEDKRWRVVAQEAGALGGSLAGGWAGGGLGAAAGCKVGGGIGTLVEPGGGTLLGCGIGGVAGAVAGTVAGAIAGGYYGSRASDYVYRAVNE